MLDKNKGEIMNSYELSRNFFDWCFENPEKVTPNHIAIYFFAIEHCNRLGWKTKFGFPTQMAMEAIGIKKHQTYIKYFNDLVDFGFFKLVQKSANQYSANIISLMCAMPKNGKALDKANINHAAKQTESNGQSNSPIDKPINKEQINNDDKPDKSVDIDFEKLLIYFNQITNKNCKVVPKKARAAFIARTKEGYTKSDFAKAIQNCFNDDFHKQNPHHLTLEFISRQDKLDKYLNIGNKPKSESQNPKNLRVVI